jgi:hypothetical protein
LALGCKASFTNDPARAANLYSFKNRDQRPDFYIENEDPLRAPISTRFPLDEHLIWHCQPWKNYEKAMVLTIPLIRQGELIGVLTLKAPQWAAL